MKTGTTCCKTAWTPRSAYHDGECTWGRSWRSWRPMQQRIVEPKSGLPPFTTLLCFRCTTSHEDGLRRRDGPVEMAARGVATCSAASPVRGRRRPSGSCARSLLAMVRANPGGKRLRVEAQATWSKLTPVRHRTASSLRLRPSGRSSGLSTQALIYVRCMHEQTNLGEFHFATETRRSSPCMQHAITTRPILDSSVWSATYRNADCGD
jgi:hypothetical protein